jgi:hypothetical protein
MHEHCRVIPGDSECNDVLGWINIFGWCMKVGITIEPKQRLGKPFIARLDEPRLLETIGPIGTLVRKLFNCVKQTEALTLLFESGRVVGIIPGADRIGIEAYDSHKEI